MKRTVILPALALLLLAACQSGPKSEQKETTETKMPVVADRAKDSTDIRNIVLSFYSWYSLNYEKLMKFDLYNGEKKKDEPPFKMDWAVVKQYKQFLRDSMPQLGEAFQANLDHLLKKADSTLHLVGAGEVPDYFDYDWYLYSQEDGAYLFEEMKKSKQWIMSINGDDASVEVKGFDEGGTRPSATVISLQMKREGGIWKIAKIGEM